MKRRDIFKLFAGAPLIGAVILAKAIRPVKHQKYDHVLEGTVLIDGSLVVGKEGCNPTLVATNEMDNLHFERGTPISVYAVGYTPKNK